MINLVVMSKVPASTSRNSPGFDGYLDIFVRSRVLFVIFVPEIVLLSMFALMIYVCEFNAVTSAFGVKVVGVIQERVPDPSVTIVYPLVPSVFKSWDIPRKKEALEMSLNTISSKVLTPDDEAINLRSPGYASS